MPFYWIYSINGIAESYGMYILGFSSRISFEVVMVSQSRKRTTLFFYDRKKTTFFFLPSYSHIYPHSYMCHSFTWSLFASPGFNKVEQSNPTGAIF